MSIKCCPSNLCSDLRCAVCGQGFLLYGDVRSPRERQALRETVQNTLREHHKAQEHPSTAFLVDWTPTDV
jgi:hypothetical protein